MLCYRCGHYTADGSAKCPSCGQVLSRTDKERKTSTTRSPQAIFSIGETVAERYKILDVIGTGGVGTVYRAHDTDIDVDVALKAVAPKLLQTTDEQKTFSKFIKTARKLHHANIVRIYDEGRDVGPQGERRFFTMQLLEGLTLRKIIQLRREKNQVFQLQEVEPIFQQLAAALDYAHKNVWHGDLKPENVLVLPDLLKVTDFCLIQALPTKPFLAIQKSRGAAYHYIAPEVRLEASRIDGRADVYSLGVMLAEMLTGELYEGHSSKNYQKALENLPKQVEALVRKATHESPDGRPQTAGEFAELLADLASSGLEIRALGAPITTPSPMPAMPPRPPPPPPAESGVHDAPNMHVQAEGSIPQLSESSVIMLEHQPEGSTDITDLPPELQSDETPAVGLRRNKVAAVAAEVDTDEQRTGRKLPINHQEVSDDDVSSEPFAASSLGPPIHENTEDSSESETVPHRQSDLRRANGAHANGRSAKDPYGPPPPLPDDPSDSGRLIAVGDGVSIHDEPTLAEKGKLGIHEALTSLKPHPANERRQSEPVLPAAIPVPPRDTRSERTSPVLPPRPPQQQKRRAVPLWPIFALIGLVVGTGAFFTIRYIKQLEEKAQNAGTITPVPPPIPVEPAASGTPPDSQAASGPAPTQPAATPTAEQPPPVEPTPPPTKQPEAVAAKSDDDDKRRKEEERQARLEEERRRKEEERQAREDDRRRNDDERQARIEEERRRKEEERQARLEEEKRRKEAERQAKLEEDRRKKEEAVKKAVAGTANVDPAKLRCPKGMTMVKAGAFKMGSAANDPMHNFEEKRLETVEVAPFCVDYYEYPNSKSAKPVTNVSWFQAQELCKAKGKRLCEEAEWEKACKGPGMARFPYGNTWDPDRCNTQDAEGNDRELAEQKAFPKCRSGYGLINMSGNASEWTASNFSASNKDRVHKGGSANRPDWGSRCANRSNLSPSGKNPFVGFRCCADPIVSE